MPPSSREIAEKIKARIDKGEEGYRSGDKLPSIAAFAAEFDVSPRTIQNVLDRFKFAGLVRSEQGRGYYVV